MMPTKPRAEASGLSACANAWVQDNGRSAKQRTPPPIHTDTQPRHHLVVDAVVRDDREDDAIERVQHELDYHVGEIVG